MKKSTLLSLLTLLNLSVFAQFTAAEYATLRPPVHPTGIQGSDNKLNAADYRLTSVMVQFYELGVWNSTDSLTYFYEFSSTEGHRDFDFYFFTNYIQAPWMANAVYTIYDGADWIDYLQFYNTYNADGNRDKLDLNVWDGISFAPEARIEYTYNADRTVATETYFNYSGGWENSFRLTYTYASGKLANILNEDWDGADWVNDALTVFTYDGDQIDYITYSYWDVFVWDDDQRDIYTYDGEGRVGDVIIQYNGMSGWEDAYDHVYHYTDDGFNDELMIRIWTGSAWEDDSKMEIVEFADGYFDNSTVYNWDGLVWSPEVRYRFHYESYDNGITSVTDQDAIGELKLYPNPAEMQVRVMIPQNGAGILSVYTLDGKKVLETNYSSSWQQPLDLDVHNLPGGQYLLQWQSEGKIAVANLVVE